MCQIWLRSDGRVEKKGGVQTDRQRFLQLYIVDSTQYFFNFELYVIQLLVAIKSYIYIYLSLNIASIVRCHSLECIAAYYNIAWLDSRSDSNIRSSAKKMGDKNTWQSQMRVYIEHCHWLLALRLSVTAAHWLGSCSCRVILFGVRKLLPRRYLMLLKPDRVDILDTIKWIALCLKCGQ